MIGFFRTDIRSPSIPDIMRTYHDREFNRGRGAENKILIAEEKS